MLKNYSELRKIDVSQFCEMKECKDDSGKKVDIPYLNWARCKELLHEHGAETVYFVPMQNTDNGYLFSSATAKNKDGRETGCYFVRVKIVIDDKEYIQDAPLLNGSLVVYNDTLNQLRIANAHARAFVKGVAIHTGLGFSLWLKENEDELAVKKDDDDLSRHSLFAIKKRIEELLTLKIQNSGKTKAEITKELGLSEKQLAQYFEMFEHLNKFEKAIQAL